MIDLITQTMNNRVAQIFEENEGKSAVEIIFMLDQRISKAIEYIEERNYPVLDEMGNYSSSDLLDILKGDKE